MAEFDWIERYLKPIATSNGARGLSDDVAELDETRSGITIATMDTLVEGVHFLAQDPIGTVARKLVRVNVSDILCKGGRPSEAMLSVAWPSGRVEADFREFSHSLSEELDSWNIKLVGGDTVSTPGPLVLTLMLTGNCPTRAVSRAGARSGDAVLVTGAIGAGGLGLKDAISGTLSDFSDHYRVPHLPSAAIATVIGGYASASIDVSDGLLSDMAHIARQSDVCVTLNLEAVPFALQGTGLELALEQATSGDDYQCLFTVPRQGVQACLDMARAASIPVTRIGEVRDGNGIALTFRGESVEFPARSGFEHS